ncbi:glycyl-radical enzyme activating protein [Desulfosporosinus fructosivorans]|uniref:Glycyl-radical enzyme activating protein n=1 Tax=Desulfosporosinus fructosivorans TaxID=2018669 RepID=A0A4Z0R9S0_9FIRM|nr:glycyl-radical enzyme activating protein [Desulfosporosinus fructosivorans]TGE39029.1 glycyl-radical enzyme activating protein [Desulfosporosinus fructosivorans]
MVKGKIFNIMKYSIHDGPGIRTTVFFKGCPLNCQWCHNPESQGFGQELMYRPDRCVSCGQCLEVCPSGATISIEGKLGYLRDRCIACGACCTACHAGVRELVAKTMSESEVMAEIEKDVIFYDESGGGVTFSGGEALMQPEFLLEILKSCRKREIHTAVETCGFVSLDSLQTISKYVDLFLYDIKLMDSRKHQEVTGVPNELILSNLRWLAEHHPKVIVRVAIIPEVNDDEEALRQIGEFVASLKWVTEIHCLPYHKAGLDKYQRLGLEYRLSELESPDNERMGEIACKLEQFGISVIMGG